MKPRLLWLVVACEVLARAFCFAAEKDPFAENVRTTEPLTPEKERRAFHLPPGFEIQLVAAEPELRKPMNMAFDATGRLWITESREYPFAATNVASARDTIRIFSDFDATGRAQKVTTFATNLNIPIGLYPFRSANAPGATPTWKCVVWSIPNIWLLEDTDGDGVADKKEVLYGPFDVSRDTHGNQASFRRGTDGWIYATHGFNNDSRVGGRDGHEVHFQSGNTYRFRLDGSRIEQWTHGQVNPFGLTFDARGNLYSADCHSSPIYQLLRDAYYPSFGKPHDGLGFAPTTIQHSHGSTAIAGIVIIDEPTWPAEFQGNIFIGNVVTSRINRDRIEWHGSTSKGIEMPDFLSTDDPWFRPVDIQLGPDGALWVADFYNRIIGHYEVPLTHPGRDRERGRIWRIVPPGGADISQLKILSTYKSQPPSAGAPQNELMAALGAKNTARRTLAISDLVQHSDSVTLSFLHDNARSKSFLRSDDGAADPSSTLSLLHQAGKLDEFTLTRALTNHDARARIQAVRLADERGLNAATTPTVIAALGDRDPFVQRAAAAALQQHPTPEALAPLLDLFANAPDDDTHLRHVCRMALREHLKLPGAFANYENWKRSKKPSATFETEFFTVARATPSPEAAAFAFHLMRDANTHDTESQMASLAHVGRYGETNVLNEAVEFAQTHFSADVFAQVEAVQALRNGLAERGVTQNAPLLSWAQSLAQRLLDQVASVSTPDWTNVPIPNSPASESPWTLQSRKCADGRDATVISSLNLSVPKAEQRTGILRSKTFVAPAKISFWLCGHRGFPGTEAHDKNFVRLVDVTSEATLQKAFPPRNNTCKRIDWDLAAHAGKTVRLEIVDGDDGKAYAWLGVTRIEPPVVNVEKFAGDDRPQKALRTLAGILRFTAPVGLRDQLAKYLPASNAATPTPASPEETARLDAIIHARAAAFHKAPRDAARGATVFTENCAGCHRLNGNGGLIGPQLDGIGNRGAARLCEDILDPNRNVDSHFFLHLFKLRDGSTLGGFVRGEAGAVLLIADANGQEQRVAKADVVEDNVTPMSLMPPVFAQTISEKDFHDLLAYLLKSSATPSR